MIFSEGRGGSEENRLKERERERLEAGLKYLVFRQRT